MSALRDKFDAIDRARPATEQWSRGHYIEKYGQHPGGPVTDATERFYASVVSEIERLQKRVAELELNRSTAGIEEQLAA